MANTMEIEKWEPGYINMTSAYPNELEKKIKTGDEIQIATILSGG